MISPVLFIIFKREDTTSRVFNRIREARPPRLYIAANSARIDRPDEIEKCKATRAVVENVDWPCEVHHLYRDNYLECGVSISSAITWFFEHEDQGIVLEDDILPHIDFFRYCDEMLERYKDDDRIQLIGGRNYLFDGYKSSVSYFMTSFGHIWGWASWKRVWKTYEYDITKIPRNEYKKRLYERLPKAAAKSYLNAYDSVKNGSIDTWDYQFAVNRFYYERYSILPFVNMIENIGMNREDAAHTTKRNDKEANYKSASPYPLVHPSNLTVDKQLEILCMKNSGLYTRPLYVRAINKLIRIISNVFT